MDVSPDEKQRIREKIEKLKQSKFKQQTLPAWRPVPTAMSTMFTFSIFSVIFLAIGILLFVMSDQIFELSQRYEDVCEGQLQTGSTCTIEFNISQDEISDSVKNPIYVYYQLDNFYQNHRRYVKSRENDQLLGNFIPVSELGACDPIKEVQHLWANQRVNLNGVILPDEAPAIPCGLVAKSIFNDTFELYKVVDNVE